MTRPHPGREKMKILLITGKIAEDSLRRYASVSSHEVDVHALPVSVAAFITPEYAAREMSQPWVSGYDMILVPGTVRGDVSSIEDATGVPTFKGPTHASEVPVVLEHIGEIELSRTTTATELVRDVLRERAISIIDDVENDWRNVLREGGGLIVGSGDRSVPIGREFPMRVIAEIVNAPTLDIAAVEKRARYYEKQGADVIDIGMLAGKPMRGSIPGLVEAVRSSTKLPVSIDTLDPAEIMAAVESGVDLVLSLDAGNMEQAAPHLDDTPVVVLPTNMRDGVILRTADERVTLLEKNISKARGLGIQKIIADPVLEPAIKPGLMESLRAYQLFRTRNPDTPMLFGLGNVTELIDADSPGVNGLLAALALEVEAELLFIPEYSVKARGSVRETVDASRMMFLARRNETPPKDLGVDLLVLKEKRWTEDEYDRSNEAKMRTVDAVREAHFAPDERGWFKIQIDRESSMIIVSHYAEKGDSPDAIVRGRSAEEIYQTIIREGLIGKMEHASYMGLELGKAEIALLLGRSYSQDEPLFR